MCVHMSPIMYIYICLLLCSMGLCKFAPRII